MTYDPAETRRVGAKYARLRGQLAEIEPRVRPLMREAAAADVPQHEIASWFGVTREVVRRACMTDEEYAQFLADQRAARRRRKGDES